MNGARRIAFDPVDEGDRRLFRKGLAFLLAPSIAAVVTSAPLRSVLDGGRSDLGSIVGVAFVFGLFCYPTELILAATVHMALPESARGAGTIVPSAGVVAAAP